MRGSSSGRKQDVASVRPLPSGYTAIQQTVPNLEMETKRKFISSFICTMTDEKGKFYL